VPVNSVFAEIHNIFLFFKMIFEVLVFTGLGAGSLIAFGYELQTKRRF
jgi:hypothetical protein